MSYKTSYQKDYFIVEVLENFQKKDYESLEENLNEEKSKESFTSSLGCIFDFKGSTDADYRLMRTISKLFIELRDESKMVCLVDLPLESERFVKSLGVDIEIFKDYSDLFEPETGENSINTEIINPFLEAAIKTLKVQCNVEASANTPFLPGQEEIDVDILAVIGVTSKEFNGSIALCMPEGTFLIIMSNMMGEEYTEINEELEDGIGELLNIIFGQAKIELSQKGFSIDKAIPSVVRGKSLKVKHLTQKPGIILPFESTAGVFHIAIGLN